MKLNICRTWNFFFIFVKQSFLSVKKLVLILKLFILFCCFSHAHRVWRLWTSAITRWVTKGSTSWKTDWLPTALCWDWASLPPNCPAKVGTRACVHVLQWMSRICFSIFGLFVSLWSDLQELWLWLNSSQKAPDCCVSTSERMRSRQVDWWRCHSPLKSTPLCCVSTLTGSPRKKLWAWGESVEGWGGWRIGG